MVDSEDRRVWLIVRSEPLEPEMLEAYEAWYSRHLARLLAVPGVLGARRFESIDGEPRFMVRYELAGPEVLESEAYRAVGRFGEMERHVRFTRNVYREIPLP
jgi:hypothetical protein